ncbi:MAG: ABC transporter substrate-binding protein [Deltaproteobacteria bacterium]|nr:ABC transporter substrate-binding protein [Deltaproteobacteria bacterium]
MASRRCFRGQDSQGRQAQRSAGRAGDQIRAGDQSQDSEGPQDHHPAHAPRPRRRGDRMISRRIMIMTTAGACVAALRPLEAEQVRRTYRIAFLSAGFPHENARSLQAFEHMLEELGYRIGENLVIEYRWAEGKPERLSELAAELVGRRFDAIVTPANQATAAAATATSTIPIVFFGVAGPIEMGFIVSLANPGKNLTGLSFDASPEAAAKSLELLHEIVPTASNIAVLRYRGIGEAMRYWDEFEKAAKVLNIKTTFYEVRELPDVDRAFSLVIQSRPDALFVGPSALTASRVKEIATFAAARRLPAASGFREFAHRGGLCSFGPDLREIYDRAAIYVDKILKGAKPADLPVEQPTKFELVINLKTANALGLSIPAKLLARADELFE